jgi:predicted kinase
VSGRLEGASSADRSGAHAGPVQRLVLVNGPPGVGKTSAARRLAATASNGACIHGDDLRRFLVSRDDGNVPYGLAYLVAAATADVYLEAGFNLVVVEFVFEHPRHVDRFRRALRSAVQPRLITLWAPLAAVREREAARTGRERLGERVAVCWRSMAPVLAELGVVIDASGPPEAVLETLTRRAA